MSRIVTVRHISEKPSRFCRICKAEFYESEMQAFVRHLDSCFESNADDILASSPRAKLPSFLGDKGWDTEHRDWLRDRWSKGLPTHSNGKKVQGGR